MQEFIKIGDIAKALKVPNQSINYWESIGLIKPVAKAGSLRLYSKDTIKRAERIKEMRKVYRLEAIRDILDKEANDGR